MTNDEIRNIVRLDAPASSLELGDRILPRINPASVEQFTAVFGPEADLRAQVYAQAPEMALAMVTFSQARSRARTLDARLTELVRLRVAFFNQCRTCMAARYTDPVESGVTEQLVCSLEKPHEDPLLTHRERVALELADRFATDHLSIDDELFDRLHEYFSDAELMELCFDIASYVGFGRMTAILDIQPDDLPEKYRGSGRITPWDDSFDPAESAATSAHEPQASE